MKLCHKCGRELSLTDLTCPKCDLPVSDPIVSLSGSGAAAAPSPAFARSNPPALPGGSTTTRIRIDRNKKCDLSTPTDLLNANWDQQDCNELTLMMAVAQAFGMVLIWIALGVLSMPDPWHSIATRSMVIGWCSLAALSIPWIGGWRDLFLKFIKRAPENPWAMSIGKRKEIIIAIILCLVVVDTAILLVLILITGGFGHSPFDALLPVIPVIAVILRQPRKTVRVALLSQICITGLIFLLIGGHSLLHRFRITHREFEGHLSVNPHPSNEQSAIAFCVLTVGAILLSFFEYQYGHGDSVLKRVLGPTFTKLSRYVTKEQRDFIKQGEQDWEKWLDSQILEVRDWSLVHGTDAIAEQAVILSLPYWYGEAEIKSSKTITRNITFLTYAAHWIDDQCDPVQPRDWMGKDANSIDVLDLYERFVTTPKLQQLVQRLQNIVPKDNYGLIDHALLRVMYGGLIQNASTGAKLTDLLKDYIAYISKPVNEPLKNAYQSLRPIVVWITTKIVMELFDSAQTPFSANITEFFNLLYGPILYYQDIEGEKQFERFGKGFGEGPAEIERALPSETELCELVSKVCVGLKKQLFEFGQLPRSRELQLECLRYTYDAVIPNKLSAAYDEFLKA